MSDKKAIAMPFNWIFAVIAGIIILFIAVYSISQFINTGEKVIYTQTAEKLASLLNPLETGLASGKTTRINFKKDTKTYYECSYLDNKPFGKQTIAFSEKTFGNKYGEKGEKIEIKNKYVFSENLIKGKKLYLFSKPFFMGFKTADLIMISSKNYCFYKTPDKIKQEIIKLGLNNIQFSDSFNCTGEYVCFLENNKCSITIYKNKIRKNNKNLYYMGNLFYAAIFSSPEIYECNIKRIKNRFNELALIYMEKLNIIKNKECFSNINIKLNNLRKLEINSSKDLIIFNKSLEELNLINRALKENCKIY